MIYMNKPELRSELKAKQASRSYSDVENLSKAICKRVLEYVEWDKVKNLHCYTPAQNRGEVECWEILEFVWVNHPHIQVFLPARPNESPYLGYPVTRDSELFIDDFGLSYPNTEAEEVPQLDLIIVPMLGFNRQLYRLGQGGGFYDRFLKNHTSASKIGLAWEESLINDLPVESHDVPLDVIFTQKHLRTSKQQSKN